VRTGIHLASIVLCAAASVSAAQEEAPATRLFDTGTRSEKTWTGEALAKREGWKLVPEDNVSHQFAGDAVLLNDRMLVVARPRGSINVYSRTAEGWQHRALLGHLGTFSSFLDPIRSLTIAENGAAAVMVEARYKTGPPAILRLRLTAGERILEIRPGDEASAIDILTETRYAVVPDFFADDMIFGAEAFRGLALPAENFYLGLLDGGDAILMCVWQSRQQEVVLRTASRGRAGDVCSTLIPCLRDKSIWLAFLEGKGIWHSLAADDGWKPPFPARWRRTQGKLDGFAASCEWGEELPINQASGRNEGPPVVYPIDRTRATPLTVYCPTDILRNTLGVGPCEYILAAEGLATPTNPTPDNVMTWLERQLKRKRGRASPKEIDERLQQMVEHVGRVRARIVEYGALAGEVRALCSETPPLLRATDWMRKTAEEGLEAAGAAERAGRLAREILALIDRDDAASACERPAAELRAIGAAHNRTLSACRMAARWLKQQCRMAVWQDPQTADPMQAIQKRIEQALDR